MSASKAVARPHQHGYNHVNPKTGKIEWRDPHEAGGASASDGTKMRSRLETDDEVKRRIDLAGRSSGRPSRDPFGVSAMHGAALDRWIEVIGSLHGIDPRRYVDERV